MSDLFDKLLKEMREHGPLSPGVAEILQEMSSKFPDETPRAREMVAMLAANTTQTKEDTSPLMSLLTSKTSIATLSVLAGGGLTFGALSIPSDKLPEPPQVTSQWALFAIVAVLGAIAGFAYSFYRNNWTVPLPIFKRSGGKLGVESFGVLRNVGMAVVVAVATVWTAMAQMPVEPTPNPAETQPPAVVPAPRSLLTWTVIVSAIVAGVVGSRMASGEVEKNTLWTALAKAVEQPAVEGLGRLVADAKTPHEAASRVEKSQEKDDPVEIATQKLLDLLDRSSLKEALKDKPLDTSGNGLTLDVLSYMTVLRSGVRSTFNVFKIADVAHWTLDDFAAKAASEYGIDITLQRIINIMPKLHARASDVMAILKSLPPNWTLDPKLITANPVS